VATQYVYAIVPTGDEMTFEVSGLDSDMGRARTLPQGDLAAVVASGAAGDARGLAKEAVVRRLLAHERVVEEIMRFLPVLPVKFGTVLTEEETVRRLLAQSQPLFCSAFDQLRGRLQMEVVVLWDLQRVFQEVRGEEPIAGLTAQIVARPPQDSRGERIAVGQMVQACLARRRAELQARLLPAFRAVTPDLATSPTMDDSVVLNVGLLLDDLGRAELDRRLALLDEEFGGQLTFRCVGPLPPYSFATVEVETPSFDQVNRARALLELGETATADEVRQTFRRLATLAHPDVNRGDPDAGARMAELNKAYRLLLAYAEHYAPRDGDGGSGQCAFTREAVERTLFVDIRRQVEAVETAVGLQS